MHTIIFKHTDIVHNCELRQMKRLRFKLKKNQKVDKWEPCIIVLHFQVFYRAKNYINTTIASDLDIFKYL